MTPGQTSDWRGYDAVMDDDLPQPKVPITDEGYDSDAIRADVAAQGGDPRSKNPKRSRANRRFHLCAA